MNALQVNSLVPGLIDSQTEFFDHLETGYSLTRGSVEEFKAIPSDLSQLIRDLIQSDKLVQIGLDRLGILSESEQVAKVYKCNYSACDNFPDITAAGHLGPREYVSCPNRGNCQAEGMLCALPFGFTKRQRDVVREIGMGLLDKEICDKLGISQDTLRNHKDSAAAKAGIERKTSLGIIAHQYKLI